MKHTYLVFLGFLALSCSSQDDNLFEIDPEKLKGDIITMSDIADDISYIPLDNTYPLGLIYTHNFLNESIYLSAKDIGVLAFNSEGKDVNKIGVKGNGPGEYRYFLSFAVDERTRNIYVLDREKIKVYSRAGVFVREIPYGNYIGGRHADQIEVFNSLLFLSDGLNIGDSKNSWVFLDTLGNLVSIKKNSIPTFTSNIGTGCPIYQFEGNLFYCNNYNDTIFSISADLNYKAAYLFSKGDHRWPQTNVPFNTPDQAKSTLYKLFRLVDMFETKQFLILYYGYLDGNAICFIDKKTKKSFLATKEELQDGKRVPKSCLLNDLDGGLPLTGKLGYNVIDGEEFITTLINPSDLKVYVSGDEFKAIVPKYPEKKKEVEKLANSLSETDNPVLMMIRLKK